MRGRHIASELVRKMDHNTSICVRIGMLIFLGTEVTLQAFALECQAPFAIKQDGLCICKDDVAYRSPHINCVTTKISTTTKLATFGSILTAGIVTAASEARAPTTTLQTNFTSSAQNTTSHTSTSSQATSSRSCRSLLCLGLFGGLGLILLIILLILLWWCCRRKKKCLSLKLLRRKPPYKPMTL